MAALLTSVTMVQSELKNYELDYSELDLLDFDEVENYYDSIFIEVLYVLIVRSDLLFILFLFFFK